MTVDRPPVQKPEVFFIRTAEKEDLGSLLEKTRDLLNASRLDRIVQPGTLVAVKQHFGEKGNQGFLQPQISRVVGDTIKKKGGSPILVETNTLYHGSRANSHDHLMLAHEHGFTIENTGMPVVILDGIHGQNQRAVPINGKHFQSVNLVPDLPFFDTIFVLSHTKGHMMSGMAGAIKNLAMGFSSRAGKLAQHADFRPSIDGAKCIRCELCGSYCAVEAIGPDAGGDMRVDLEKCTGCGECHVVCQSDAISFDWAGADRKFNEKMAEHALGAIAEHPGKVAYINYFVHVSKHCDCWDQPNPPLLRDIGIFAGFDPVAVDRACFDVGNEIAGYNLFTRLWPKLLPLAQLEHGEEIGLGRQGYDLKEVS
jgi:uncharacterized protein